MKQQLRVALAIGGVAVTTAVIGLGVFLYVGSQLGVYIIGIGTPLVVISGIGLYVRGVVARDTTSTGQIIEQRARSVASKFRDELLGFNRMWQQYSRWEAEPVQTKAETIRADLSEAGVEFDLQTGEFEVKQPHQIQQFSELEPDIVDFADLVEREFEGFATAELNRAQTEVENVSEDVLRTNPETPPVTSTDIETADSVSMIHEQLESLDDYMERVYADAISRIRSTLDGFNGDRDIVTSELEAVQTAVGNRNWAEATASLERAKTTLDSEVSEEFSGARESLEALLSTIESVDLGPHVPQSELEDLAYIRQELQSVESAIDAEKLDRLWKQTRSAATALIRSLEAKIQEDADVISQADVPVGFYTMPPVAAEDYTDQLQSTGSVEEFRQTWLEAAGQLPDAVETSDSRASVAESYEMIADQIESQLGSTGRVTATDLPVKEPIAFFELYAENHSSVSFNPATPELVASGGGDTYEVEITAQFPVSTGEEQPIEVSLSGDSWSETITDETYIATVATFDEVPYGEYDVSVDTPVDQYATVSDSLTVNQETTAEFELAELSIVEQVCGSNETELRDQLPTVAPKLTEQFEQQQYLSPELQFPIADELLPCLLAIWAEENEYTPVIDNGEILVYDHAQFRSRLDAFISSNLADGDTMDYETLRSKFLDVPASDELIASTLRELELDATVEPTQVTST